MLNVGRGAKIYMSDEEVSGRRMAVLLFAYDAVGTGT